MRGGGRRKEEAVLTDRAAEPRPKLANHSTLCPAPRQQGELAAEIGAWELGLPTDWFWQQPRLRAWILLLRQDKTAPGGSGLATPFSAPQ